MRSRTLHLRAYTLLELVLVLAIVATLIAVAAPRLSGFARARRAEEAARQFVALTHWARSQAVANGVTLQVTIDAAAGQWRLGLDETTVADAELVTRGPFEGVFTVPEGVEIQTELPLVNGRQAITFDATGRCDTGTIRFVGHGSEVTVACDAPIETYRILKDNGGRS